MELKGWECRITSARSAWTIWFNVRADGSVMHQNCISRWRGEETDAYALIRRAHAGGEASLLVHGSFVRCGSAVRFGRLSRQTLVTYREISSLTHDVHKGRRRPQAHLESTVVGR